MHVFWGRDGGRSDTLYTQHTTYVHTTRRDEEARKSVSRHMYVPLRVLLKQHKGEEDGK